MNPWVRTSTTTTHGTSGALPDVGEERLDELEREVVDAAEAQVLEAVGDDALSGAGQAGHDDRARRPRHQSSPQLLVVPRSRYSAAASVTPRCERRYLRAAASISRARLFPGATGTVRQGSPEAEDLNRCSPRGRADRPVPSFSGDELDDQVDRLAVAHGDDAEELLDRDQAEPADLHQAADLLGGLPDEVLVAHAVDLDDVVGDQAMAPVDQLEGALALSGARFAEDEHADGEDVQEVPVDDLVRREEELQRRGQALDDDGGRGRGERQRHGEPVARPARTAPAVCSIALVTTMSGGSSPTSASTRSVTVAGDSVVRNCASEKPMTCTLPGLTYSRKPARARPGFCSRGFVTCLDRPASPATSSSARLASRLSWRSRSAGDRSVPQRHGAHSQRASAAVRARPSLAPLEQRSSPAGCAARRAMLAST